MINPYYFMNGIPQQIKSTPPAGRFSPVCSQKPSTTIGCSARAGLNQQGESALIGGVRPRPNIVVIGWGGEPAEARVRTIYTASSIISPAQLKQGKYILSRNYHKN